MPNALRSEKVISIKLMQYTSVTREAAAMATSEDESLQ